MALKIALLALLVCCAASEAQSQGDDTSLPLSYNARTVINDITEDSCPEHAVRDEIIEMFSMDVQSDIQDTVFPSLLLSQGWTRVAYLDLTNSSHQCPAGWQTYTTPTRSCGRNNDSASCQSVFYPTKGGGYSRMCGRIIGYQYRVTMAFSTYNADPTRTIDAVYVDGISITHGSNPREHMWTFASAFYESYIGTGDATCHCTNANNSDSPNILVPPFVGDDYFCDTGTFTVPFSLSLNDFFTNNPLWDGKGCGPTSTCCELNNPPWFCKTLPVSQPVTDDIELRTCGSHSSSNRDFPIELIELLVL